MSKPTGCICHIPEATGAPCVICRAVAADAGVRANLTGQPAPPPPPPRVGPCRHLGAYTGRTEDCGTCPHMLQKQKVMGCTVHGETTAAKCEACRDYAPQPFTWVAPAGTADQPQQWTGRPPRSWGRRLTVAIPHLNTLDILPAALDLWRLQTERPYLVVIDTGSPPDVCKALELLRADDLEVHFIRAHGYVHSSAPVAVALDLAQALCRSDWLLHTHADVFPRRRDLAAWLLDQCSAAAPVVGWEMSPRTASPLWRGTVSHTCTICYMPTLRASGATWSMERYYDAEGMPAEQTVGWPDTESGFRRCLIEAGIVPKLLGGEPNFERHVTEWFDHARSVTGVRAYGAGPGLREKIEGYAAAALVEARARAVQWRAEQC